MKTYKSQVSPGLVELFTEETIFSYEEDNFPTADFFPF